jgi:hypothetical protein
MYGEEKTICLSEYVDMMIKVCLSKNATRKMEKTREILQDYGIFSHFIPDFSGFLG